MTRKCWKPNKNMEYTEHQVGCSTCANSVFNMPDGERKVMCGAGWPEEVDNGDGTVTIYLSCSGKVVENVEKERIYTRKRGK